jgi:hypothetical protein
MSIPEFSATDDGLHAMPDEFYATETFWYSFFVPERAMGGWLYTSLRQNAGTCAGGAWIWNDKATDPWQIPFFEQYSWLRYGDQPSGPQHQAFPTGMSIDVRVPLMSYDMAFTDRDRLKIALQFDALEPPVALRSGTPPYPAAHHFDQTGRTHGTIELDGETIEVDCYAMRDRSWGPRFERGYHRVGYSWAAAGDVTFLTYSIPSADTDNIHTGYFRIGDEVSYIADGRRRVERDPVTNWVTGMVIEATDEQGRELHAQGRALSRMILPGSTTICVNTSMEWTINGTIVHGEDQDVWPIKEYRLTVARNAG